MVLDSSYAGEIDDTGLPALMFTDTAEFRNPNYHRPTDTAETLVSEFWRDVVAATQLAGSETPWAIATSALAYLFRVSLPRPSDHVDCSALNSRRFLLGMPRSLFRATLSGRAFLGLYRRGKGLR